MNEAKYRANKKYNEKTYARLVLQVRKDAEINGDVIRRYAESKGISLNALLIHVIEDKIRNDPDFVI